MEVTLGAEEAKMGKGAPPNWEQAAQHQKAYLDGAPVKEG